MSNNNIINRLEDYRTIGPIGSTNVVGKLLNYDDVVDAIDEIKRLQKIVDEDASIREDEGTFARGAANSSSTFTIDISTFEELSKAIKDSNNSLAQANVEIKRLNRLVASLQRQILDYAVEPEVKSKNSRLKFGTYYSLGSGHFIQDLGNNLWSLIRWNGIEYSYVKENISYDDCLRLFNIKAGYNSSIGANP